MKKLIFIILIIFAGLVNAQKTNMEQITGLIEKSVVKINRNLIQSSVQFKFNSPENYSLFSNSVKAFLSEKKQITDNSPTILNYSLENINVEYPEIFRDGLFGNFLLARKVSIKGAYSFNSEGNEFADTFTNSIIDTVAYESIRYIENPSLNFSKGIVPEEPFLSGIWEPVIAISALAASVYLFFTVRSN